MAIADKGVTPENNALPLLIKAAGPECFNTKYGDGKWVMQKLGMPPFTINSPSLITFTNWLHKHPLPLPKSKKPQPTWVLEERVENQFEQHPWTAKQYPSFAQWIKINQRVKILFMQAMQRSRYYIPLRSHDGSLDAVYSPDQQMIGLTGTVEHIRDFVYGGSLSNLLLNCLFKPLNIILSEQDPNAAETASIRETVVMRRRLTVLTIALALYRKQYDHYPAKLSQLMPLYITAIPRISFTGGPLYYTIDKSGQSFLIYCIEPARTFIKPAMSFGRESESNKTKARKISVHGGNWHNHSENVSKHP